MNRKLGLIAGVGLLGLTGCGDSAIVERCIDEGKSPKICRCADRIIRSELSGKEYRLAEKVAKGNEEAVQDAMKEEGAGFTLAFFSKMTGATAKIAQRCREN